jgi:anti-anti-sigma regulatory factor
MHQVSGEARDVRVLAFAMLLRARGDAGQGESTWAEFAKSGERVIVDLGGIACLHWSWLEVLLRFRADVRASGGEVSLSSLSGRARHQAQKMQLHRILEVFNTPEEAARCYLREVPNS